MTEPWSIFIGKTTTSPWAKSSVTQRAPSSNLIENSQMNELPKARGQTGQGQLAIPEQLGRVSAQPAIARHTTPLRVVLRVSVTHASEAREVVRAFQQA